VAKSEDKVSGRRDFLKLATAAEVKTELGYSETPHVKAYLDSCRF